jgi:hypothetical protein
MEGKTSINFFYFCLLLFSWTSDFSESKFCETKILYVSCLAYKMIGVDVIMYCRAHFVISTLFKEIMV